MRFCWHRFGKWSEPNDAYDGSYQHAACEKCNAIISRKMPYDGSTSARTVKDKLIAYFKENNQ